MRASHGTVDQVADFAAKPPVVKTVLYKKFDPQASSAAIKSRSSHKSSSMHRYQEGQLVPNVPDGSQLQDYATNIQVRPQSTDIRGRPKQIGASPNHQHETINTLPLHHQHSINSNHLSIDQAEGHVSGQYEIMQDTKNKFRKNAARTNIKVNQRAADSEPANADLVNIDAANIRNNQGTQQSLPYLPQSRRFMSHVASSN